MQNRMKYRFGGRLGKFLAGLLVSAAVAGCVRDDTDPLAGPDAGSSGELRIAFSIDGMEAVTRAVATDPHERNLKDVLHPGRQLHHLPARQRLRRVELRLVPDPEGPDGR